jgi:transketolase
MRKVFIDTLCRIAAEDERVMLLTTDLGWSVLEPFADAFPKRFINLGVAEQNMLGVATGLALEGYVPFAYSIATFASMRCYEQFRDGPVLHRLPVRLVGIGGGFAYGHAGPTHHALEDLVLARSQPGVTVLAPADGAQTRSVIKATRRIPGPVYLRIDKTEFPDIPDLRGRFALARPELVRRGNSLLYLTTGSIVHEVLKTAEILETEGMSASVAHLAHLSYSARWPLRKLLSDYDVVVTVEEGTVAGGLGSLVAETIAEHALGCRLSMQGVKEPFLAACGSSEYMRQQHRLDSHSLAALGSSLVAQKEAA